jgi:hypothetical protein
LIVTTFDAHPFVSFTFAFVVHASATKAWLRLTRVGGVPKAGVSKVA